MRAFLSAFLSLSFAVSAFAQSGAPWTYQGKTGALVWGKLDPAYKACSTGHEQSPVDLRGARLNASLKPLEFHYLAGSVTVANTGLGIDIRVNPGSYMVADGVRYNLVSYEFHHPSEHTVRGKFSDMEVDFIHRSADNKEAIVAIRLSEERGDPNAIVAMIWDHLPQQAGKTTTITEMVNPGGLLPADRGYWTYMGSELTPPCAEGVHWFVFEQEISMSRSQFNAFAALYKVNTRPVQDLRGRKIEADE